MLRFQIACRRNFRSVVIVACELYLYVENVNRVVAKAVSLGATAQGQVMHMFWGDRCGIVVDPDGYSWMVGTHRAEPTAKEMKKKMNGADAAAGGGCRKRGLSGQGQRDCL
jgi:hypothetical protein